MRICRAKHFGLRCSRIISRVVVAAAALLTVPQAYAGVLKSLSDYGIQTLDGEVKKLVPNSGPWTGIGYLYVMSPQGNPAFATYDGRTHLRHLEVNELDLGEVIWLECGSEASIVDKPHYTSEFEQRNFSGYHDFEYVCGHAIRQEAATNDMARRLGFWSRDGIVRRYTVRTNSFAYYIVSPQGNPAFASIDGERFLETASSRASDLDMTQVTWLECVGSGLSLGDPHGFVPKPGYDIAKPLSQTGTGWGGLGFGLDLNQMGCAHALQLEPVNPIRSNHWRWGELYTITEQGNPALAVHGSGTSNDYVRRSQADVYGLDVSNMTWLECVGAEDFVEKPGFASLEERLGDGGDKDRYGYSRCDVLRTVPDVDDFKTVTLRDFNTNLKTLWGPKRGGYEYTFQYLVSPRGNPVCAGYPSATNNWLLECVAPGESRSLQEAVLNGWYTECTPDPSGIAWRLPYMDLSDMRYRYINSSNPVPYNVPDHWCTKLRNLELKWRVAEVAAQEGPNSMLAWGRNPETGDIQCFSRDGTHCVTAFPFMQWGAPGDPGAQSDGDWLSDEGYLLPREWSGAFSNNLLLNLTQRDFQDVKPLVCTDEAYRQTGHWCEVLLTRINEPWKERLGLQASSLAPGISYIFSPQGNPACLSLDGDVCADLNNEPVQFSRITFLECGPEGEFVDKIGFESLQVLSRQKGFFGAGYEDPDHWCTRLRNDAVAWRPMEKKIDEDVTHRYYWSYTAMGEKFQILSLDGFTPYVEKRVMGIANPWQSSSQDPSLGRPVKIVYFDEIKPVLSSTVKMAAIPYVCNEFDIADEHHPCYNIPGASFQNYRKLVQQRIDNNADTIAALLDAHAQERFGVPANRVDEWSADNLVINADADFDYAQAEADALARVIQLESEIDKYPCYCFNVPNLLTGEKVEAVDGAACALREPATTIWKNGREYFIGNGLSGLTPDTETLIPDTPNTSRDNCHLGAFQLFARMDLKKETDIVTSARRVLADRERLQEVQDFLALREMPAYQIYSSPEFRNMSPTHAYALLARHAWEAPLLQHLKDYYEADSVEAIRATHQAIASHPGLEFIEDEFLSITHIDDLVAAMDAYYDNQTVGNFFRFLGSIGESALSVVDPMGLFSAGPRLGIELFEDFGDTVDRTKDFLVDLFDHRITEAAHVEERLLEVVGFDPSTAELIVNLGSDLASAEFEKAIEDASKYVYTEAFPMISEAAALLGMSPADGGSSDVALRIPYNSLEELKLFGVEDMDATHEELDYFDSRKRSAMARFKPDAERGEACINLWHTNPTKWENLDNLFAFSMGSDYWEIVRQSAVPRDVTGDNEIDRNDMIASLCDFLFERVDPENPNFHVYADSDFHLVGSDVLGGRPAGFMYDDEQGLILLNRDFVERDGFDDWFPQYAEELGHAVNWARCFIFDMKPISTHCEVEGDPGKRFRDAIALPYDPIDDSVPDAFALMLNGLPDHDKNEHRLVSFQGGQGEVSTAILEGDWDINHGRIWEGFGPRDGDGGYSVPFTWGGWLRAGLDFSNSASKGAVSDDFQLEVAFTYPHMRRIGKPTVSATDHRECSDDELGNYDWDRHQSTFPNTAIGEDFPIELYPDDFNGDKNWKWLDCEVPTWWWDFGFRGRNRIELAGADGPTGHNQWGFSVETNLITKYTFSVPVQRMEPAGDDLNVKVQGRHWRYVNKHIALVEPGLGLNKFLDRLGQEGKYHLDQDAIAAETASIYENAARELQITEETFENWYWEHGAEAAEEEGFELLEHPEDYRTYFNAWLNGTGTDLVRDFNSTNDVLSNRANMTIKAIESFVQGEAATWQQASAALNGIDKFVPTRWTTTLSAYAYAGLAAFYNHSTAITPQDGYFGGRNGDAVGGEFVATAAADAAGAIIGCVVGGALMAETDGADYATGCEMGIFLLSTLIAGAEDLVEFAARAADGSNAMDLAPEMGIGIYGGIMPGLKSDKFAAFVNEDRVAKAKFKVAGALNFWWQLANVNHVLNVVIPNN